MEQAGVMSKRCLRRVKCLGLGKTRVQARASNRRAANGGRRRGRQGRKRSSCRSAAVSLPSGLRPFFHAIPYARNGHGVTSAVCPELDCARAMVDVAASTPQDALAMQAVLKRKWYSQCREQ